ncbi:hypothetical protein GCM10022214_26270 [Actinomadura miaoliensis]|uniref:Tn3 transposase DDE domain-containing protein n=1 Tax=Actinomadura miaoliensis TaxID=430685 RepID=A0ABP7VL95_9ACTN
MNDTAVVADGTQVETYIDNLLAETSIRYGGVGGIAHHHVSDTYVALFSRFILLRGVGGGARDRGNESDIQPATRARRHPRPVGAGVHPDRAVRFRPDAAHPRL